MIHLNSRSARCCALAVAALALSFAFGGGRAAAEGDTAVAISQPALADHEANDAAAELACAAAADACIPQTAAADQITEPAPAETAAVETPRAAETGAAIVVEIVETVSIAAPGQPVEETLDAVVAPVVIAPAEPQDAVEPVVTGMIAPAAEDAGEPIVTGSVDEQPAAQEVETEAQVFEFQEE